MCMSNYLKAKFLDDAVSNNEKDFAFLLRVIDQVNGIEHEEKIEIECTETIYDSLWDLTSNQDKEAFLNKLFYGEVFIICYYDHDIKEIRFKLIEE